MQSDWGSGLSNADGDLRLGALSEEGDATWRFPHYSTDRQKLSYWPRDQFGGDFDPEPWSVSTLHWGKIPPLPTWYSNIFSSEDTGKSSDHQTAYLHFRNMEPLIRQWNDYPDGNYGLLLKFVNESVDYELILAGRTELFSTLSTNSTFLRIAIATPIPAWVIATIGSMIGLVVLVVAVLIIIFLKRREQRIKNEYTPLEAVSISADDIEIYKRIFRNKGIHIVNQADLKLKKRIGSGSSGTVYSGILKDDLGSRHVAIKHINLSSLISAKDISTEIEMLSREIDIMRRLAHPNVLHFVGMSLGRGQVGGIGLVTDLIEYGSLAKVLHADKVQFTYEGKLQIMSGVASGMAYLAHQQPQIIHRDLKTENILMAREYIPKIADFGLSRMVENKVNLTIHAVGTALHVSPEAINGNRYTEQSDIFSFGVVMLELYHEKRPHKIVPVTFNEAFPLATENLLFAGDDVPSGYRNLINQCLSKDPSDRGTFSKIVSILDQLLSPGSLDGQGIDLDEFFETSNISSIPNQRSGISLEIPTTTSPVLSLVPASVDPDVKIKSPAHTSMISDETYTKQYRSGRSKAPLSKLLELSGNEETTGRAEAEEKVAEEAEEKVEKEVSDEDQIELMTRSNRADYAYRGHRGRGSVGIEATPNYQSSKL
jgi:serine/threonine protein kinase